MISMLISGNKIKVNESEIYFGMPFAQAENSMKNEIYTMMVPDENGFGHIIVMGVDFYGLKGESTFYFRKGRLATIGISQDWKYNHYRGVRIDVATDEIAKVSESQLERAFGSPVEKSSYGNSLYEAGNFIIITSKDRRGDNYSIVVKWNCCRKMGFALASKELVEKKMKVRYMYREKPDNEADSGWRFFTGNEKDEYVDNPDNIAVYDMSTIAQIDPDIIPLLDSRYGISFERENGNGVFKIL